MPKLLNDKQGMIGRVSGRLCISEEENAVAVVREKPMLVYGGPRMEQTAFQVLPSAIGSKSNSAAAFALIACWEQNYFRSF